MWYRTGTVTVTNGSRNVTGSGTAWFSIITGGWGFRGPDGRVYEIESVSSDTAMLLAENYLGTTLAGQAYAAYPTQALTRSLTERVSELISTFTGFVTTRLAGLFGAGSVSAPGVAREGDTNTGIYWPADDELSIATGGVQRVRVDSAGLVGIGGIPTANRLEVYHATNGIGMRVRNSSTGVELATRTDADTAGIDAGNAPGGMTFSINTAERVRIDASGNVGVGTTSPAAKLDVRGASSVLSVFASDQSGSAVMNTRNSAAGNATQWYVSHVNENVITGNARGGYHAFWTDGAERMRITPTGQVGIGTIPDAGMALDVDAGATRLQLSAFSLTLNGEDAGGGVARSFRFRPSTTTADANAFNLGFYGNANVAEYGFMAFPTADPSGYDSTKIVAIRRDSGFFGVGTVSPGSRLQVNGDAAVTTEVSASTRTYIRGGYFPSGYGARIAFESNAAAHSDAEMIFERAASVGSWVESCRLDRSGRLIQTLSTSVPTLQTNRQLVFTMISNTVLRASMRGDDGVQRSVDWNLS